LLSVTRRNFFSAKKIPKPTCNAIADVGFLLDSSGSLRKEYSKEKDFLKALVAMFGVSKDGSRAAVVTFSAYSKHSIKLKDHSDLSSFNKAVDAIPLMNYTTRIDRALRMTEREMFTIKNGARPGINKVLIILTDGSQTQDAGAEDPGVLAEELRQAGINIISVGIGKSTNPTELAHLAGGEKNFYYVATFDELISADFLKKVSKVGCVEG
jgi:nitric oxide reductase activation protein